MNIDFTQYIGQYVNNVFNILRENYPSLEMRIIREGEEDRINTGIKLYYNPQTWLLTRVVLPTLG